MTNEPRIEAGRELDALIAEEVMGWRRMRMPQDGWVLPLPGGRRLQPDAFSTSGACLEVLERMREQGWNVLIETQLLDLNENTWRVAFDKFRPSYIGDAPTLPHAICLAALEAVRAEKDLRLRGE